MSDNHDKAISIIDRSERVGMSPVVSAGLRILEHSPNPETLRELLAMQRDWEANEARKAYASALVGLKVGLPTIIAHDKLVNFNSTRYTHTSLGAAVEAVTPHLINHGFTHSWYPATNGANEVSVTCRLTHQAGHFEEVCLKAPPDNKGAKNGAQAVASTVTMLERYTLLALLGIATADMSEPEGRDEAPADNVNSERNLKAVGWLKQNEVSVGEAEQYLSRKVPDWTAADLGKLKAWVKKAGGPK